MTDKISQWWSDDAELMDIIYDMASYEEKAITSLSSQSLHDYALFSTGMKLSRTMNHAGSYSTQSSSLLIKG